MLRVTALYIVPIRWFEYDSGSLDGPVNPLRNA